MTSTHESPLALSVKPGRFNQVFTEVPFATTHHLPRGTRARLFHLSVDTDGFTYKDLCSFIQKNVSNYVFSRAQIADYVDTGEIDMLGWDASDHLRTLEAEDPDTLSKQDRETLGQILLYSFLEYVLGAPKVLSRFQLDQIQGGRHSKADALHLLPAVETVGVSQFVLGASYIDTAPLAIIDGAFDKIAKIKANRDNEVSIVEQTLLDKAFAPDQLEAIERLIIPDTDDQPTYDTSYGIFVGYSLGLQLGDTRDGAAYRRDLDAKLRTDLMQHVSHIADKITECGLEHHNFHIYTLPLNDARVDPSTIMSKTLRRRMA